MKWYKKQMKTVDKIPKNANGSYYTTDYVNDKTVLELEAIFKTKAEKITIYPLLLNNHCHQNVGLMLDILNKNIVKYRSVLGFNIISRHSGDYLLELHSVLQHIETNELIDLTDDYCSETEKWFIAFTTDMTKQQIFVIIDMLNCGHYNSISKYEYELDGNLLGFYNKLSCIKKIRIL
jgi:hypothetical protein